MSDPLRRLITGAMVDIADGVPIGTVVETARDVFLVVDRAELPPVEKLGSCLSAAIVTAQDGGAELAWHGSRDSDRRPRLVGLAYLALAERLAADGAAEGEKPVESFVNY